MIDIVTGASGFIGKHLMRKIGSGAIAIKHDEIGETAFPDCDRFFFLSTYGNYIGHDDLSEVLRSNIGHLGYVLAAYIEESKCESFVYMSSSSVNLPVQTPYSHAKRAGEEMALASCLPACVVRPYSVTGVGEQAEHLIPTLIRSCLEGERMRFVPDAVHDFVDVEDVVAGLIMLSEKRAVGRFELGNGLPYRNSTVKEMVEEICGRRAVIREVDSLRDYDYDDWYCKDDKARDLGWKPTKDLFKSISEMVAAHKFKR